MARRPAPLFLARAPYRQRRVRDASRLLPVVGIVLWLIPLFWSPNGPDSTTTSTVLIYIFVVWSLLVLCSFALSRWLTIDGDQDAGEDAD